MKRLLCVLAFLIINCGCAGFPGIDPPRAVATAEPAPFANAEQFEKLVTSQADTAASGAETVTQLEAMHATDKATNELLTQLIDQQKLVAGQQCDMLKELQDLKQTRAVAAPEPQPARSPSSLGKPPLWFPEGTQELPSDTDATSGLSSGDGVPQGTTITVGGETTTVTDFIAKWYKGPWAGEPVACLQRFGISEAFLQTLSVDTIQKLHGAVHEHEQQTAPKAKPVRSAPASKAPAIAMKSTLNCPGGVCPNPTAAPAPTMYPNQSVYQPYPRRLSRVFGRRW